MSAKGKLDEHREPQLKSIKQIGPLGEIIQLCLADAKTTTVADVVNLNILFKPTFFW